MQQADSPAQASIPRPAGMLSATAKTLSTPLPRVYDKDVRTGQAVATFESLSERERLALTEEEINLRDLEAIKHHTVSVKGLGGKQRDSRCLGYSSDTDVAQHQLSGNWGLSSPPL